MNHYHRIILYIMIIVLQLYQDIHFFGFVNLYATIWK